MWCLWGTAGDGRPANHRMQQHIVAAQNRPEKTPRQIRGLRPGAAFLASAVRLPAQQCPGGPDHSFGLHTGGLPRGLVHRELALPVHV